MPKSAWRPIDPSRRGVLLAPHASGSRHRRCTGCCTTGCGWWSSRGSRLSRTWALVSRARAHTACSAGGGGERRCCSWRGWRGCWN
jgi:hypothetical protein